LPYLVRTHVSENQTERPPVPVKASYYIKSATSAGAILILPMNTSVNTETEEAIAAQIGNSSAFYA